MTYPMPALTINPALYAKLKVPTIFSASKLLPNQSANSFLEIVVSKTCLEQINGFVNKSSLVTKVCCAKVLSLLATTPQ